jgi:hypothetical protein
MGTLAKRQNMRLPLPQLCSTMVVLWLFAAQPSPPLLNAATSQPSSSYRGPTTTASYVPLSTAADNGPATSPTPQRVGPISETVRRHFDIPPFYTKGIIVRGMPIIGSDKVSDYAFLECGYVLDHMLAGSPAWVRSALTRAKVKVGIISVVEFTMDIPENQTQRNMRPAAAAYQDRRSRGLGGIPLATCGEENLLNLSSDPYRHEDITIHEFSHTVAYAIGAVNRDWYRRLRQTYQQAMKAGLFAHSYSATDEQEYWAEGAQAWFDCADPKKDPAVHSGIWTREQLKHYDPDLATMLAEVYGDGPWRYVRTDGKPLIADGQTTTRPASELAHLAGLDRAQLPAFNIRNSPRVQATQPTTKPISNGDRAN